MKQFMLLGKQVAVNEIHGEVMEATVSKDVRLSGGGGVVNQNGGYISPVRSTTLTSTKLFIHDGTAERSVTVPGEPDVRRGHEIIYLDATLDGRAVYLGIKNESMHRAQWKSGEIIAAQLGLIKPTSKTVWAFLPVVLFITGGLSSMLPAGPVGGLIGLLFTALLFFYLPWLLFKKFVMVPKLKKRSTTEVENFVRTTYLQTTADQVTKVAA